MVAEKKSRIEGDEYVVYIVLVPDDTTVDVLLSISVLD